MVTTDLKVLVLDIETSPVVAYVWGLRDQNISLNQIKTDWYLLAWSAKWLGDPASEIMYMDQRNAKDLENDLPLLKPLWNLLDEADIVITQNGQHFDGPKLNARFILHGMNPPSPYRHLDTYQIVRRVAAFTSNKLEYLTDKLCTKYKKLAHKKFSGMSLWTACLAGNKEAWKEMEIYNKHDVLSTEEFYMKIRAWAPDSMPKPHVSLDPSNKCGVCGIVGNVRPQGHRVTKTTRYMRYQCKSCGSWSKGSPERLKKAA